MALMKRYDLILLSQWLPDMNGLIVCKMIKKWKPVPVIMLTEEGNLVDQLEGFQFGADDAVSKPFSPRELVLRIKALLRRWSGDHFFMCKPKSNNVIILPHIFIEHDAHRIKIDDQWLDFTPKEYSLLHYFAIHPNQVCTREQLLKEVWHFDRTGADMRTIDTHVKRLRIKLRTVSHQAAGMLETVWGSGYRLNTDLII